MKNSCCVFWPAFGCVQHPKAGQNIQHIRLFTLLRCIMSQNELTTLWNNTFWWFSSIFHRFWPCKLMCKHAFAGWNTQEPLFRSSLYLVSGTSLMQRRANLWILLLIINILIVRQLYQWINHLLYYKSDKCHGPEGCIKYS